MTLASLATPLHFDETFWVSIARMVFRDGRTLYVTAIDNKSPVVYLVSGLLDALPGPFFVARALFVGLLAWLFLRGCRRLEVGPFTSLTATAVAILASGLVLTTELPAAVALAWSLVQVRTRLPWRAVGLIALAALIDPRSAVIGAIIVVLMVLVHRSAALGATIGLATLGLVVVGGVMINDDLRFGLIELNLASRGALGGPTAGEVAAVALVVILPLGLLAWLHRGAERTGWILLTGAGFVALASVNPFPHYWIYATLAVPYLRPLPAIRLPAAALAVLATVPLLAMVVSDAFTQADVLRDHRMAAEALERVVDPDETFAQFALVPYPYFFSGREIALDAPGIHYLTWDTTRRARQLEDLQARVGGTGALIGDRGFTAPREALLPAVESVRQVLETAPHDCRADFGRVVLFYEPPCVTGSS